MKIDIHTHTRKCKSGDVPTREISPEDFCSVLTSTDVGIIAITNHNVFDLEQFEEIQRLIDGEIQVWSGVELDVVDDDGVRGHLLIIVSPKQAKSFHAAVSKITKDSTPDDFTTVIGEVLTSFDDLNPLYVAHYKKAPMISESVIAALESGTKNPCQVLKEAVNAISAGIFISHGHASIYGTDIHDWKKYKEQSAGLPDLRLPVDSFEHFCLLLRKDPTTITTLLGRKTSEELTLKPFPNDPPLKVTVYNDINVVFGPKGTGKSCILKAIARHYSESGIDTKVYESSVDRLDQAFDVKGKDLTIDLSDFDINYCTNQIDFIRTSGEVDVASLSKYQTYFETKRTNKNAAKIKIKDLSLEDDGVGRRGFLEASAASKKVAEFMDFLSVNQSIKSELTDVELSDLTGRLSNLLDRLSRRKWNEFLRWKEVVMFNSAIKKISEEVSRKSGVPKRPVSTGFKEYAINRMKIEICSAEIVKAIDSVIPAQKIDVGSLGTSKGALEYQTEFLFQNGHVSDSAFQGLSKVNKTPQKQFAIFIRKVHEHAYSPDLFPLIADLNEVEGVEGIKSVYELLLFKRYFCLSGSQYTPSSGEASMVMLQKELGTEKDVYILDEPEKSLGNEYISDVIVPMIKERARAGKRIFISTHDANIAVRTLPYSSIYRCHGESGYSTYVGNPFACDLVSLDDVNERLDWRETSMRTLEGGREAFGERGNIYGRN